MPKQIDNSTKKNELFVSFFFAIGIILIIIFLLFMFFRSNWFFLSNSYITYYEYGSDIKSGTIVTLNGIKVGEVKKVDIDELNRIRVDFTVLKKYRSKIKKDSVAKIVRPLLIGNKQINISAGSIGGKVLSPGSVLLSEDSSELIDLVSGRSLQSFIDKLGMNPDSIVDDELGKISVRDIYDKAVSSLVTMNEFQVSLREMSMSMKAFADSINDMSINMQDMGKSLESMKSMSVSMDGMGGGMKGMSVSFEELSESISEFKPLSEKIIPMLENLDIILEAIQRNSLLRKDVERVKKEKNNR